MVRWCREGRIEERVGYNEIRMSSAIKREVEEEAAVDGDEEN